MRDSYLMNTSETSKLTRSNDFQFNEEANAQELQNDLNRLEVIRDKESKMRMICSQPFLVIYFMNILSVITGFFTVNNFKKFGQLNGLEDENYLAWVGSAAAFFNSIRFVWSFATDFLSYKMVYTVMLIM